MGILLALIAWVGLAGIIAAGWSRFFRRAGSTPLPDALRNRPIVLDTPNEDHRDTSKEDHRGIA
jgi:hypothetical protein